MSPSLRTNRGRPRNAAAPPPPRPPTAFTSESRLLVISARYLLAATLRRMDGRDPSSAHRRIKAEFAEVPNTEIIVRDTAARRRNLVLELWSKIRMPVRDRQTAAAALQGLQKQPTPSGAPLTPVVIHTRCSAYFTDEAFGPAHYGGSLMSSLQVWDT
ncbi:hypothetical protein VTO73DRAFT_12955 [Trametes versicolor]